jgi:hypothetical protein
MPEPMVLRMILITVASCALALPGIAKGGDGAAGPAVGIQGGWWSVEAEWRSESGVLLAAGVPWLGAVLTMGSAKWVVPYGFRAGYQHEFSRSFKFRGAAHVAGTYGREAPCGGCGEIVKRTFGFLEIGGRYEARSGFVAGVDVPIAALGKNGRDLYPPPLSLAFSQAYVGFCWGL